MDIESNNQLNTNLLAADEHDIDRGLLVESNKPSNILTMYFDTSGVCTHSILATTTFGSDLRGSWLIAILSPMIVFLQLAVITYIFVTENKQQHAKETSERVIESLYLVLSRFFFVMVVIIDVKLALVEEAILDKAKLNNYITRPVMAEVILISLRIRQYFLPTFFSVAALLKYADIPFSFWCAGGILSLNGILMHVLCASTPKKKQVEESISIITEGDDDDNIDHIMVWSCFLGLFPTDLIMGDFLLALTQDDFKSFYVHCFQIYTACILPVALFSFHHVTQFLFYRRSNIILRFIEMAINWNINLVIALLYFQLFCTLVGYRQPFFIVVCILVQFFITQYVFRRYKHQILRYGDITHL